MKNLVWPLLLAVAFYVFLIVPALRRRRTVIALQRGVHPGSRVMLQSGLYGTVVSIDDDTILIEAAEGVELRYAKAAVLRVIPDLDEVEDVSHADERGRRVAGVHDDTIEDSATGDDTVVRPSNRDGNDAGSGAVPSS